MCVCVRLFKWHGKRKQHSETEKKGKEKKTDDLFLVHSKSKKAFEWEIGGRDQEFDRCEI